MLSWAAEAAAELLLVEEAGAKRTDRCNGLQDGIIGATKEPTKASSLL
jgi:hypothetical protein